MTKLFKKIGKVATKTLEHGKGATKKGREYGYWIIVSLQTLYRGPMSVVDNPKLERPSLSFQFCFRKKTVCQSHHTCFAEVQMRQSCTSHYRDLACSLSIEHILLSPMHWARKFHSWGINQLGLNCSVPWHLTEAIWANSWAAEL